MVLAGCRPLALFASEDDGKRWWPLGLALPPGTPEPHTPRVTAILFDRGHPEKVWAGAMLAATPRGVAVYDGEKWALLPRAGSQARRARNAVRGSGRRTAGHAGNRPDFHRQRSALGGDGLSWSGQQCLVRRHQPARARAGRRRRHQG